MDTLTPVIQDLSQVQATVETSIIVEEASIIVEEASIIIDEVVAAPLADSYGFVYISIIIVIVLLVLLWRRGKSKSSKRQIALIGERGSGKTQLFINLCGGKTFMTVPSIVNNNCETFCGNSKYTIRDFMGDNLSKEEVLSELPRFHILVHVVDGTDSKKLADAALFIYRVLINKQFQKQPCHYVLFLNKEDDRGFYGLEKLAKRIEDEIQTIKLSRRSQPEDNEGEQDFLRNERTRFDLKKQSLKIVLGSSTSNIKLLKQFIDELC